MLLRFTKSCRSQRSVLAAKPLQRRFLSIHEYQAQNLLAEYGVPVPKGHLATSGSEVKDFVARQGGQAVIKAQILAGGRGKGTFENGFKGGVHVVSS